LSASDVRDAVVPTSSGVRFTTWWRRLFIVVAVAASTMVWLFARGDIRAGVFAIGLLLYFWPTREVVVLALLTSLTTHVAIRGGHVTSWSVALVVFAQGAMLAFVLDRVARRGRNDHYGAWFALALVVVMANATLSALLQATVWLTVHHHELTLSNVEGRTGHYLLALLTCDVLTGFVVALDWRSNGRRNMNGLAVAFLVVSIGAASIQITTLYWGNRDNRTLHNSAVVVAGALPSVLSSTVKTIQSAIAFSSPKGVATNSTIKQTLITLVNSDVVVDAIGYFPLTKGHGATSFVIDQQGPTRALDNAMGFGPRDATILKEMPTQAFYKVLGVRTVPSAGVTNEKALVYLDVVHGAKGPLGVLSVAISLPAALASVQSTSGVDPKVVFTLRSGTLSGPVVAQNLMAGPMAKNRSDSIEKLSLGTEPFTLLATPSVDFGTSLKERSLVLGGELGLTLLLLVVALQSEQGRRRSRTVVQERNELLNTALAESAGVVAIINGQGRVVFSNVRDASDLGVYYWSDILPFRVTETERARVEAALARANSGESDQSTVVDASSDVRPRYYELSIRPLTITFEGATLRLLRCVDVTELRERDVRNAQFERLESLSAMARGLAHDFNNLLFIISGYLGQVLEEPAVVKGGSIEKAIQQAVEASHRGSEIADALLTVAGGRRLSVTTISVWSFLEGLVPMATRALGNDHHLAFIEPTAPWALHLDVGQLTSAVLNLVINARDASPVGSTITLEVHVASENLPGELPDNDYVVFQVSDQGSGVDPAIATRIFDPYFTTKPRGRGSGLGLATVLAFARQSGGTVELINQPGAGATFNLYFPVAEMPTEVAAVNPTITPHVTRILVVDDEQSLGELVASWLNASGFEAHYESSPEAALQQVATFAPQALVTDVELGGSIDGIELASRILFQSPDIKVVFMTGYSGRMTTLQQRGMTVLAKPFRREDLLELFATAGGEVPA